MSARPSPASRDHPPTERVRLFGLPCSELSEWCESRGLPSYRGRQIAEWLYGKRVCDFESMTNLPSELRNELDAIASVDLPRTVLRQESLQDDTTKFLFELEDGERIESVLMREPGRLTLCVSSQVGCSQACAFCASAQAGLKRNLTAEEIVGQIVQVEREVGHGTTTNVVFMGMGEPLANYKNVARALSVITASDGLGISSRRVTVSTSGLVPAIDKMTGDGLKADLALSLNATTDELRNQLIPSNRRYTISNVLKACHRWTLASRRRLTVEYVLFRGVNDSREDARRLGGLLRTLRCQINLIPFNPVSGTPFMRPEPRRVSTFWYELDKMNQVATIRSTRGQDIDAACGQLRAEHEPLTGRGGTSGAQHLAG